MPLTTAAREAIVTALRLRAGIGDRDGRIRMPAIELRDDGTVNTTAAAVQVTNAAVVLTGNSTGTDSLATTSGSTTLASIVASIEMLGDGRSAELVAPDGAEAASSLLVAPQVSILSTTVVLYVQALDLLDQLVDDALARMERYCRRRLADDGTDVDRILWRQGRELVLDDAGITYVAEVAVDTEAAIRASYSGSGRGTIGVTPDAVQLWTAVPGNATVLTSIDLADDSDIQGIADAIEAVTGWTATMVRDGSSDDLVAMPPQDASTELELEAWVPADGEYRVDLDAGLVMLDTVPRSWSGEQARVKYRAGFAALPADLEGVLLTVAKAGLDAQRRDAGLQSESLGDYSWTAAAGSVPAAAMDDAVRAQAAVLDTYRRLLP